MPFERRLIEAKLALGRVFPEEMPELACDAMEAGCDGPNLQRLSALDRPTAWEIDRFIAGAKLEMGIVDVDRRTATLRLGQDLARKMLGGTVDVLANLDRFERLWIDGDYPVELSGLGMLADEVEWDGDRRANFESQVMQELEKLVECDVL